MNNIMTLDVSPVSSIIMSNAIIRISRDWSMILVGNAAIVSVVLFAKAITFFNTIRFILMSLEMSAFKYVRIIPCVSNVQSFMLIISFVSIANCTY
jgi:hypothetical protein